MEQKVEIAPLRLGTAVKGLSLIYGLTILSCFILNAWMKTSPIGPWVGEEVLSWYWFDNVTFQLMALWWALMFAVVGYWPFNKIQNGMARGFSLVVVSWVLGFLTAKAFYWSGLGAGWVFPVVGCLFFYIAFFSFTGENWVVANLSPPRQFFVLMVLILGLTYVTTNTALRWIPAWWFPFIQMGAATGLLSYLTRKMPQPVKGITQMALLFLVVGGFLCLSRLMGFWDPAADGVSGFWNIGYLTPDNVWLLWFMVGCSVVYGVLMPLHNWPFTKIPMPWGGFVACGFCVVLIFLVTSLLKALVGPVFADMNEALTYGYMGVNWSFVIPLIFGVGLQQPYLWAGQKTPGTWDDVDG